MVDIVDLPAPESPVNQRVKPSLTWQLLLWRANATRFSADRAPGQTHRVDRRAESYSTTRRPEHASSEPGAAGVVRPDHGPAATPSSRRDDCARIGQSSGPAYTIHWAGSFKLLVWVRIDGRDGPHLNPGGGRFARLQELWENPIMFLGNTSMLVHVQAGMGQQTA
jgi:hypothetical protein